MAVVLGAGLLAFYSAVRFSFAGAANLLGLRTIRQWEAIDWAEEYSRRASADSLPLDAVHHVVIIPNYREDLVTLRRTLDRLAGQRDAATSINIVLAMEVGEPGLSPKAKLCGPNTPAALRISLSPPTPRGCPARCSANPLTRRGPGAGRGARWSTSWATTSTTS